MASKYEGCDNLFKINVIEPLNVTVEYCGEPWSNPITGNKGSLSEQDDLGQG